MDQNAIFAALGVLLLIAAAAFFFVGRSAGKRAERQAYADAKSSAEQTANRIVDEAKREAETLRKSAVLAGKEESIKLREQWEARGPGLLRAVGLRTEESLVADEAQVIVVQPALGGGGQAHLSANAVRIEAVLANPHAELPEVVRLAWLLAQLQLDLPAYSDRIQADRLPHVLSLVVSEALSPRSALGFGLFVAMRYGIARGVYASEAGYGTAAVAYGTAKTSDPAQQGLQAVMEVFIISFVTTTLSALTILVSGVAEEAIAARQAGGAFLTSTAAVAAAFDAAVPTVGGWVVAFCVLLFGYTTLTGWAYYGEQFLEYLFGRRIVLPYRWVYCLLIPLGAVLAPEVVWAWGDLMNALQIFPNVIGLVGLSAIAAQYATKRVR